MSTSYSPSSGLTILELLVAMSISLVILLFVSRAAVESQASLQFDVLRNRINENQRSLLESVGSAIQSAGAGLPPFFPAVVLENNSSPDIYLRSSYLPEVGSLMLCNSLSAGSTTAPAVAGVTTLTSCPQVADLASATASIQSRLSSAPQNTLKGYIFNRGTNVGEFFEFNTITNAGSTLIIPRSSSGGWSNTYPPASSSIFFISEARFRRSGRYLELFRDGDYNSPQRVAGGLDNFTISMDLVDPVATGTTQFGATNNWTRIRSVNIEVLSTAPSPVKGLPISRSSRSSFYPRNALSKS